MPELPDVQVFKEYFDATSLHRRIAEVVACDGKLLRGVSREKLNRLLAGRSFSSTRRHGKYLFARFGEEGFLVLHFGMTGFLRAYKDTEKGPGHIRLLLRFRDGYHLAYDGQRRLGRIGLTGSVENFISEHSLGPDALDLCADKEGFVARLAGHRCIVKSLLMNQKVVAGIGNIYGDEILYRAGIHPKRKADTLKDEEWRLLAGKTCRVLKTAVAKRAGAKGWPQGWLLPRRETGMACPRCSGRIKRITVSGRGTYFCPGHQA